MSDAPRASVTLFVLSPESTSNRKISYRPSKKARDTTAVLTDATFEEFLSTLRILLGLAEPPLLSGTPYDSIQGDLSSIDFSIYMDRDIEVVSLRWLQQNWGPRIPKQIYARTHMWNSTQFGGADIAAEAVRAVVENESLQGLSPGDQAIIDAAVYLAAPPEIRLELAEPDAALIDCLGAIDQSRASDVVSLRCQVPLGEIGTRASNVGAAQDAIYFRV